MEIPLSLQALFHKRSISLTGVFQHHKNTSREQNKILKNLTILCTTFITLSFILKVILP